MASASLKTDVSKKSEGGLEGVSLLVLQPPSVFQAEWSSPGAGSPSHSWIANNTYQRVCVAEGVNTQPQRQICWESEAPAGTKTTAAGLKKSSNTFLTFQILLHFHHTRTTNPDLTETVINRQKHPVEDWEGNQSAVTRIQDVMADKLTGSHDQDQPITRIHSLWTHVQARLWALKALLKDNLTCRCLGANEALSDY